MAISYSISIDQAEIELAVQNHIRQVMNLDGDVVIKITNGGRQVQNLAAAIDLSPKGSKKAEPVKPHMDERVETPVVEEQMELPKVDVTPMAEIALQGEVGAIMSTQTLGDVLDLS